MQASISVTATVDAGADVTRSTSVPPLRDLGADAAVDLGSGTVDVGADAGVDLGVASLDTEWTSVQISARAASMRPSMSAPISARLRWMQGRRWPRRAAGAVDVGLDTGVSAPMSA